MKLSTYVRSPIGTKQIMAIVGLFLCMFLITHLAGNLLIFKGEDTFNGYAKMLASNPLIIPAELGLLAVFLIHLLAAIKVTLQNWSARPVNYVMVDRMGPAYWPSYLMVATSVVIVIFLVVHLITFKYDSRSPNQIYEVVVERFSSGPYVAFYVFCMIVLGIHLFHGFQSAFLTLGLDHPKYTPIIRWVGYIYAILMALGYSFIPISIYLRHHCCCK